MTDFPPPTPDEVAARRPFEWRYEFERQRWLAIGLTVLAVIFLVAMTVGCSSSDAGDAIVVRFNDRDDVVLTERDEETSELVDVPTIFTRADLDAEEIAQLEDEPGFDSRVESDTFVVSLDD